MIVSQLHLLFIRLHNRLLADIRAGRFQAHLWDRSIAGQFREAQRLTRWHYQYVVATDFLRRICGTDTLDSLLQESADGRGRLRLDPERPGDRRRYTPRNTPYMPVEFSVGAYRYGHS